MYEKRNNLINFPATGDEMRSETVSNCNKRHKFYTR